MHRVRGARMGLTVYPPSRTLEPLAFDEYCRFDTSAFFYVLAYKASLGSNVRYFLAAKNTVLKFSTAHCIRVHCGTTVVLLFVVLQGRFASKGQLNTRFTVTSSIFNFST
jgi:hypothetical protein